MFKNPSLPPAAPERALILTYAPPGVRGGLAAMLALDDAVANILRSTREPMLVQMRLTWWHDALTKLDAAPPPAEPVLQALASDVLPFGIEGAQLARLVEGWEALSEGDPCEAGVRVGYAVGRGGALFALAARLLGDARFDTAGAGQGWALADLARNLADPAAAAAARAEAETALVPALARRWPGSLRSLGALAHLAAMDLRTPAAQPLPAATPGRVARLAWHRLTGR
ncbi:squalene/phytoene synthase family protein [Sphingomonas qomolangmaensis]|uniref:Squalene/phytoene synthase family protein n=1 Tax=Sphingomonas qomolangmaensis TaxID=2918765 RepID=A0ABY5LBW6_9SPHN|nr:squalene/phytoene synthase family protein [Sphingomonas qomolangmaensis]UUL83342.1 squalene/phytoene synthase family protein [Sphingomonas qomolangmaensis]